MKKLIWILPVFLLAFSNALAGDMIFKVLAVKGKVMLDSKEPVKIGQAINTLTNVELPQGGELLLMHKTGRTKKISAKGKYSLKEIDTELSSKKSSVSGKFLSYVADEIVQSDAGSEKSKMKHAGAVERAIDTNAISIAFPPDSYFIPGRINCSWKYLKGVKNYTVVVNAPDGKELVREETKSDSWFWDAEKLNLSKEECYYWHVEAGKMKSANKCLYFVDCDKQKEITTALQELHNEVEDMEYAYREIVVAAFYESHSLYADAFQHYTNALTKGGKSDEIKNLYNKFLSRVNMNYLIEE